MIAWLNQMSFLGTCNNLTMIGLGIVLAFAIAIVVIPGLRKKFF